MFSSQEKNSIIILLFLIVGWPIGLDRFYEGDSLGGTAITSWWLVILPVITLKVFQFSVFDLRPSLIIIAGYGLARLGRKMIVVARTFVKDGN